MKNFTLFLIVVLSVGFYSCQKEETTQLISPQSLTKSSTLTALLSRVSQNPTTKDNVIDGTSCFSVLLPVSLTVDSQNVTLLDASHYDSVSDITEAYDSDDDVIHFNFPITLQFPNFQEIQVNSQAEYNNILLNCGPDTNFHEIECIDFNYPIVINTYDSSTQTPNTITITTDNQLYNFVAGLTNNMVYNIVYPLSMTKSNGDNVVYHSNSDLQAGIENVINACNNSGSNNNSLSDVIDHGSWKVSSFIDGDEDETYHFSQYVFTFASNGTAVAVQNSIATNGNWSNTIDDGYSKLNLSFYGDVLLELEKDWRVIEYSQTVIKLRHVSGDNGKIHYLNFIKV